MSDTRDMGKVWTAHDAVRDLLTLFDSATGPVHYALAFRQTLTALQVPLRARRGVGEAGSVAQDKCRA